MKMMVKVVMTMMTSMMFLSCGEHSAMGTWRHLWWLEGDGYIAALVVGRQR